MRKKPRFFLQQHRPGASLSGQVGRQAEMAGPITCLLKKEATGANHSQTGSQKVERPTLQRTSVEAGVGLPQRRETDPPASQNWVKSMTKTAEALPGFPGGAVKRKPGTREGNTSKTLDCQVPSRGQFRLRRISSQCPREHKSCCQAGQESEPAVSLGLCLLCPGNFHIPPHALL